MPSNRDTLPFNPNKTNKIVIIIENGNSLLIVLFLMRIGTIMLANPKIIATFKILDPMTFPMVIPALPLRAAVILTAASGKLVPIATMVKPMTNCGIP